MFPGTVAYDLTLEIYSNNTQRNAVALFRYKQTNENAGSRTSRVRKHLAEVTTTFLKHCKDTCVGNL